MALCKLRRHCKIRLTSLLVMVGFLWCQAHFDSFVATAHYYLDHGTSGPTLRPSRNVSDETCEMPPPILYGVPWPKCQLRMSSLTHENSQAPCFRDFVREGDVCSNLRYLSEVRRDCPPLTKSRQSAQGEKAIVRTDFDELYRKMKLHRDYTWMLERIQMMEKLWIHAASVQYPPGSPARAKKRIHVHPGLLQWGLAESVINGAPVGELMQWSDLLASLHILGHDVVLTRDAPGVKNLYDKFLQKSNKKCNKNNSEIPFDIIYTDIIGYKEALSTLFHGTEVVDELKCRIRIVDSWGTEADYNDPEYAAKIGRTLSYYGGLGLDLRQFNTLYPHTPDNTFLGFVIEKSRNDYPVMKKDIALLYGKTVDLLEGKYRYIDILGEYFEEVHATIRYWHDTPKNVKNHGVLPQDKFAELLGRTKVYVGFGSPYEGPGALEAIQFGAIFLNRRIKYRLLDNPTSRLNRRIKNRNRLLDHPTSRVLTSQNTYAEKIGKPYVYTLDIDDETEVREVLKEVACAPDLDGFLPFEFSAGGMLQRVGILVEKQNFCARLPYTENQTKHDLDLWPPLSALKKAPLSNPSETCSDACTRHGLVCEPSFFPVLNRMEAFLTYEAPAVCISFDYGDNLEFPAMDDVTKTCYLQTNQRLFSCAGNDLGLRRFCPCRDFIAGQTALCKDCLLS